MIIRHVLLILFFAFIQVSPVVNSASNANSNKVKLTDKQIRVLQSLDTQQYQPQTKPLHKTVRLKVAKLTDNQGQVYLAALVSRAELSSYLIQLEQLLGNDFQQYRALQAARDHQLFHMTLLSPREYQLADKTLVEKLLAPEFNNNFSSQLKVTLLGLGKVALEHKKTFFVVAQSGDAQLIRQRFLLSAKDFHVTLGFNLQDIYGVSKGVTTLID
ncbi:MAG: hypothetical protein JKY81_07025 [Colwellia sp.]|nr:hypothetical protein [Colwellia sp.]